MMTIRKKTLIEPKDIIGAEIECCYCLSTYSVKIASIDRDVPSKCPNCRESWMGEETTTEGHPIDTVIIRNLRNIIRRLQERKIEPKKGAIIRLEISEIEQE